MSISDTEKLNLAIVHGSRAYTYWDQTHHMPSYLTMILYELTIRKRLTQKQLVDLSDFPKQSINKGIKQLSDAGYLLMTVDPEDKRVRFCELTPNGRKYAQEKLKSLFKIEEKTAQKLGKEKMKQLTALNEEWSNTFWHFLNEERSN
ncbi:MarR family winged helix-turn-helix transcriptional regulator [uncultured Lactobacillus sp.]|uniref:MarR family winged helix-turn-helix transcriptional regulator n=1 Tax=uncultured Lactobacillus sp. TaxID=153152 RepID=UPI002806269D|nr:MarR family winged helix-turn-helix transcriptional regulator [uncultured Lactobacillus sp.]